MKMEEWLKQRAEYIRGLKKPNQQQELLLALADKTSRNDTEERKLAALAKAERADERAQKAKAELKKIDQEEKARQRKKETHKKIVFAGVVMADIKDGLRDWGSYKDSLDKRVTRAEDRELFGLPPKLQNQNIEEPEKKSEESKERFFSGKADS